MHATLAALRQCSCEDRFDHLFVCCRLDEKSKSEGGHVDGGTDAIESAKPANVKKSKQDLVHDCLSDTRLSKLQVC